MFGRDVGPTTCIVFLFASTAVLAGLTGWLLGRLGSPTRWPTRWRIGVASLALVITAVWWWIDEAVEGSSLVEVTGGHGLTTGDLLMVPGLVLAVVVLGSGLRRRR